MGPRVEELRADVDVQSLDSDPRRPRAADRHERVLGVEPELGAAMAGANRLVGLRLHPRSDTDESSPDSRRSRPLGLVECIEHDERVHISRSAQLLVRLVVPVEENLLAPDAGRPRERELPERRDVGADALLREQA